MIEIWILWLVFMNLSLDLYATYALNLHAQDYMKQLGITYEHATPQSIADCWWFWNCENVPNPLPYGLSVLKIKPSQAIGYGLSKEIAEKLEQKRSL